MLYLLTSSRACILHVLRVCILLRGWRDLQPSRLFMVVFMGFVVFCLLILPVTERGILCSFSYNCVFFCPVISIGFCLMYFRVLTQFLLKISLLNVLFLIHDDTSGSEVHVVWYYCSCPSFFYIYSGFFFFNRFSIVGSYFHIQSDSLCLFSDL